MVRNVVQEKKILAAAKSQLVVLDFALEPAQNVTVKMIMALKNVTAVAASSATSERPWP